MFRFAPEKKCRNILARAGLLAGGRVPLHRSHMHFVTRLTAPARSLLSSLLLRLVSAKRMGPRGPHLIAAAHLDVVVLEAAGLALDLADRLRDASVAPDGYAHAR